MNDRAAAQTVVETVEQGESRILVFSENPEWAETRWFAAQQEWGHREQAASDDGDVERQVVPDEPPNAVILK